MTRWVRAIKHGWVLTDRVPGPDVDEFAEAGEVVAALAGPHGGRDTLLAVQHPHRTPEALAQGLSLADALPAARQALDRLRGSAYRQVAEVVAPYRVDGPDGVAVGLLCLVDPAAVDVHGMSWVRHSEEVYPQVVVERAAVLAGLGCATSAAMLVPVIDGAQLTAAVLASIDDLRAPAVSTIDSDGRTHQLWLLGPGTGQDAVLATVARGPLLVADGNHRVAAAAASDRSSLLALVTGGPALRISAIHRALVGTELTSGDLVDAWLRAGLVVQEGRALDPPRHPGSVVARTSGVDLRVTLPEPEPGEPLPRIDHGLVERVLIAEALGIDPAGPHVRALPAGHPAGPHVDAVLQLAAVPFADVLAVHQQGRRMPRKSTYFTPKPRSGLLLADLTE
ncbi:MAG: DUF1015 domain-containing protein [Pseudonocardiales bacterium]|nr:DUF1015 family protein [Actinomycetota bacterium]PZS23715.1 MAG: DUF1015 domain-containing protein [Pseudonocardiales bacterium]